MSNTAVDFPQAPPRVLDDGQGVYLQAESNRAAFATNVTTTAATSTTPYGFATAAQADALVARMNSVLAALRIMLAE
jgi:hypothetical protein